MQKFKDIAVKQYKKIKLKKIIEEFFSSTTIHGLGRIYGASNHFTRCFWILAFLGILAYLIYNVLCIVQKLNGNNIVTVTQATSNTLMNFPAITVCNANPFRKSEVKKVLSQHMVNESNTDDLERRKTLGSIVATMSFSQLFQMGHLPDEFLVGNQSCSFGDTPCSYPTDFQVSSTSINGNCFTFNSNNTIKQERPGQFFGLTFTLNVNQDEYDLTSKLTNVVGAFVTVHHPSSPATLMSTSVLAGPGQLTRIALRHERVTRLPHPYPDNCTKSSTKIMEGINYNSKVCFLKCFIDQQHKFCGVVDSGVISYFKGTFGRIPRDVNYTIATKASDFSCIWRYEQQFKRNIFKCSCPATCKEDIFRTTVSSARWPSRPHANKLLQQLKQMSTRYSNWTSETLYENLLSIEIFFEEFSLFETKQKPEYDSNNFLSDLGGQLGLWIGASVFSVLELMAFISHLTLHGFDCHSEQNKVHKIVT